MQLRKEFPPEPEGLPPEREPSAAVSVQSITSRGPEPRQRQSHFSDGKGADWHLDQTGRLVSRRTRRVTNRLKKM